MLRSETIRLDYMCEHDLHRLAELRSIHWQWFMNEMPIRKENQLSFYQEMCIDETRQIFGIYKSDIFVGSIGFKNLDRRNQNAEYGNLVIDYEHKTKGIAFDASHLLLQFMFDQMNLKRVYLEVVEGNSLAISLYKKLGFTIEGVKREAVYSFGKFHNVVMMSILISEYSIKESKR